MKHDFLVYVLLHCPFILGVVWVVITSWNLPDVGKVGLVFGMVHIVTFLAYLLRMGDDFAIYTYWAMYLFTPIFIIFYKLVLENKESRLYRKAISTALAIPILGLFCLVCAIALFPPKWQ